MPFPRRSIDRRTALLTLAAGGLLVTGCTRGGGGLPTPPTPPASPTPMPLPGTLEAAELENDLAARCDVILDRLAHRLDRSDRNLLIRIRDAHLAHRDILQLTDPVRLPDPSPSAVSSSTSSAGPSSSTPSATTATTSSVPSASASATGPAQPPIGRNPDQAFYRLRDQELEASDHYRDRTVDPDGPSDQLGRLVQLWGSLATASAGLAEACRLRTPPGPELLGLRRLDVPLPDESAAVQDVVGQCHAMIYGYQTATAALTDAEEERARERLTDARVLRDRLSDWLIDHDTEVPSAEPGYRLPIGPADAGDAERLIIMMERRLLPYLGQWLATATEGSDRKHALDAMINTARTDLVWSGRITVWPGWPTDP